MLDGKEKEALLCSKYNNINRLLAMYNVDKQDREDLLQNIFVSAFRSLDQLREADKMDAWLWSITRNEINRYWRKVMQNREMIRSIDTEDFDAQAASIDDANCRRMEEEIDHICEKEELVHALRQLPDKTLFLFRLYYFEGYKLREIAKITGEKESAVKSRHTRGLVKLKEILEEMNQEEES